MHVRCPHCHNAIEIVGDHELTDIECSSCGSTFNLLLPETESWTPTPQWMDHFQLLDKLGTGGFGTVWKARDTKLDRLVALKIPRRSQVSPAEEEAFLREARAAAQLRHPHIVAVHEVGRQESGDLYIVSDLIHGVTLADRMTAGPFTPREAAQLCVQIADALHHAHESGVIHRDLKPQNIMLDSEGQPHIMDFGLAKRDAGEITMTVDGKVLGTPAYMSPQQAGGEGHHVDRRTDVYSLGVILFELLTGELPFRGNQRMLLHQVINEDPPSPRKFNSRVPRDLETICLKCLEKEPHRRYATAAEFSDELQRWFKGESIIARPNSLLLRFWKWYGQRTSRVAGAIAIFSCAFMIVNVLVTMTILVGSQAASSGFTFAMISGLIATAIGLLFPGIGVRSGIAAQRGSRLGLFGAFLILGYYAVGGVIGACFQVANHNAHRGMWTFEELNTLSYAIGNALWFLIATAFQFHALTRQGREQQEL